MRIRKSERDYTNTHTHKLREFGWCTNGLSLSAQNYYGISGHTHALCSASGDALRWSNLLNIHKIKQREHGNVQQPAIRNNTSREKLKKQHNITVYVSVVSYSLQQVQIVGVTSHWVSEHWTHYAIVLIPSILSILQLDIIYIYSTIRNQIQPTTTTTIGGLWKISSEWDSKKAKKLQTAQQHRPEWVSGLFVCAPCMTLFQFLLYEKWLNFCLFAVILLAFVIINIYNKNNNSSVHTYSHTLYYFNFLSSLCSIIITYEYARFNRNSFIYSFYVFTDFYWLLKCCVQWKKCTGSFHPLVSFHSTEYKNTHIHINAYI